MQKIIFIILSIFLSVNFIHKVVGQKNFQPGYVLTLKGDTIKGQIDYRNWKINPDKIDFIAYNNEETTFTPLEIVEFGVGDELYKSGIIDIESSVIHLDFEKMSHTGQFQIEQDTIFLQALFRGSKELYYYYNKQHRDYFYIVNNGQFELLRYKKYLKKSPNADPDAILSAHNSVLTENTRFKAQLTYYLQDCPSVKSKISKMGYGLKSMYRIFESYQDCVNPDEISQKERDKITTEFGVVAGVSLSSINFDGIENLHRELIESDFGNSVDFSGGLFFEFIFPRAGKKWSIPNELLYTSYTFSADHTEIVTPNVQYTDSNIQLEYSYIKLINMIRYSHPLGSINLFFNAGMTNGFVISEKNKMYQSITAFSSYRETETEPIEFTRKYEQGLIVGLGGRIKNYSVEFRYESSNGISDLSNLESPVKRLYFLLGYRF